MRMVAGLLLRGRARREDVRPQAARLFEQGVDADQIAKTLRVATKSVYQWRRAWRSGGDAALASEGPGGSGCMLDEQQLARLCAALDAGPAAHGWAADQRWTLARVSALIARLCDSTASSPDSSARPDSPSSQNP
jgi:transposase